MTRQSESYNKSVQYRNIPLRSNPIIHLYFLPMRLHLCLSGLSGALFLSTAETRSTSMIERGNQSGCRLM